MSSDPNLNFNFNLNQSTLSDQKPLSFQTAPNFTQAQAENNVQHNSSTYQSIDKKYGQYGAIPSNSYS